MVVTEGKTRKPPTFQHLPKNRAKKLKQSWIENKKIKNKWKAQKIREGLTKKPSSVAEENPGQEEEENDSESDGSEAHSRADDVDLDAPISNRKTTGRQKGRPAEAPSNAEKPSLRDMKRQAYSPSSLHSQKVDPLLRRRGGPPSRGANSHRGRGGRGGGDFSNRGREKGQPNMKLRMNAMLEKIKRDFS
ncbi:hypothetical protein HYDPIDRAFT_80937 [Hydnomerulius pinastri MD-312]|nr:hypothetical protein HYDPIDRAFT_80937 [Hydnomerulius pinastri MD-312]